MLSEGVYASQTRRRFILRYLIMPLLGVRTPHYIVFILRDRLFGDLLDSRYRAETLMLIAVHVAIAATAVWAGVVLDLLLFWWLPYVTAFAMIGWLSELSEHFPMMRAGLNESMYAARNRYAAWYERLFIGMHGDNYHLTHHLLPQILHWNLGEATGILREDAEFRAWDSLWGGIFSRQTPQRVSFIGFVIKNHVSAVSGRLSAPNAETVI